VAANPERAAVLSVKIGMSHIAEDGVLATSEQALRVRAALEKEIASQPEGTPIELDFSGVRAITVTFADECIGRVLSSRLAGFDEDHPIFATRTSSEVRTTLAAALRQLRLSLLSLSDEKVELLGGDETLGETIDLAMRLESSSVNEIAEELGLTAQAANNRLVQLVRVGALSRSRVLPSRGGREFRYSVPATTQRRRRTAPRRSRAPA
jgi:hypothetical protein